MASSDFPSKLPKSKDDQLIYSIPKYQIDKLKQIAIEKNENIENLIDDAVNDFVFKQDSERLMKKISSLVGFEIKRRCCTHIPKYAILYDGNDDNEGGYLICYVHYGINSIYRKHVKQIEEITSIT